MSAPKLNILVSYAYINDKILQLIDEHKKHINFVLDSGAFTAYNAGKIISLDDYCSFLSDLPIKPWRYFTLDVIGNAQKTYDNYTAMLSKGFEPVPIFTAGEKINMLETYYNTSDLVGLGGLVGNPRARNQIKTLMRHISSRKVHFLGFTNSNYLKHYKPYMCDSSGWNSCIRFGSFKLYLGSAKFQSVSRATFMTKPLRKIVDRINLYGFNVSDLTKESNWRARNSALPITLDIAACSYIHFSIELYKKLGVNLFMATPASNQVQVLINNYYKLKKLGII